MRTSAVRAPGRPGSLAAIVVVTAAVSRGHAVAMAPEHGTPDGELTEHVERHRDGSLRARGPLLDGEPHGAWEWFRLDGSRLRSGTFDRGAQVGEWTTYDRQSRPYKTTRMGPAAG